MENAQENLRAILRERAYTPGLVTLASGKQSDFYIDCRKVALTGQGHQLIGHAFLGQLQALEAHLKEEFAGCAGMALGAVPLASALSLIAYQEDRDLAAVVVRKEAKAHGTGNQVEGADIFQRGDKLILLEDVVTSGGSAIKAINALRDSGFIVEHALCLVDREEGGAANLAEAGVTLHPLFRRADFMAS